MAANNRFAGRDTSLITILSTVHGQLRREQRDIDKRDLRKALKYGKRESAWGQRWLVEYDGITFITDQHMMQEVTAYPSPLKDVPVGHDATIEATKVKSLLKHKPELATSHTVLVIDNSGSMLAKKNDVHLYRDSQNAAFSMMALDFVAEQLLSTKAVNSDLVSLVKFSSVPSVEFEREPISWPIYNTILTHRNVEKFKDRQYAPILDSCHARSNYLPTLAMVADLLKSGYHPACALSVFFLSDGQSTDHKKLGISAQESYEMMKEQVKSLADQYRGALTVTVVGLGNQYDEFQPLKEMASAATASGAKGSFEICSRTAQSLSSAISSMVTSTTETRLTLQGGGRSSYTERDLTSEMHSFPKKKWSYFMIDEHFIFDPSRKGLYRSQLMPLAAVHTNPEEASRRMGSNPPYLAINGNYFGKGAERVAFRCQLSDDATARSFVFNEMIAKETKHNQRIEERTDFHKGFAETQDLANYLASNFNILLRGIPQYDPFRTPQLIFISCSVLDLLDFYSPHGHRGVLVEKMLDTERFRWTKWNDNNGAVNGQCQHMPIDVDFQLKELRKENLLVAIGEDDEETDDDSISDVESEGGRNFVDQSSLGINPSDYLQAFTHFTYRFTNKRVMVCDLQGVFNTDMCPPTFEMTDPAIHYASAKGRRMVYGRSDKGKSGMNAFFKTHKCTPICQYLHLSARNKKWSRKWRHESTQRPNFRA